MTDVAVIVPVLGRPANAERVAASLAAATPADAYRLVFVCTPGDDAEISAARATEGDVVVAPFELGPGDWARKINLGYRSTEEEFVFLGADDLRFWDGWLERALEVAGADAADVIGTNDRGNPQVQRGQLATHALVRRSYADERGTIDEPGKILHEGYFHNWVDAELTETAVSRGRFAFARRSVVEHLHPNWRKAEMDDTYRRALDQRLFEADRRLLAQRRRLIRRGRAVEFRTNFGRRRRVER